MDMLTSNVADPDPAIKGIAKAYHVEQIRAEMGPEILCELALVWDPPTDTADILGVNINRDYSKVGPGQVPGSLDLVSFDGERGATLVDIKTGRTEVPDAFENWQLKHNALALARAYGLDTIRACIFRVSPTGWGEFGEWVEWGFFDLEAIAAELRERLQASEFVTGTHCRWCPARNTCEARVGDVMLALAQEELTLEPENAARAWALGAVMQDMGKAMQGWAKSVCEADGKPIPTTKGKVLAFTEGRKSTYQNFGNIMEAVIGAGLDPTKISMQAKSALERAYGKEKAAGLMAHIREHNGQETKPGRAEVREVSAKSKNIIENPQGLVKYLAEKKEKASAPKETK